MHCKYERHDHSVSPVMAAIYNPGMPPESRPYHCPDCHCVNSLQHRKENWQQYPNVEAAKELGWPLAPCRFCFPASTRKENAHETR
jgi:hypothetical protein